MSADQDLEKNATTSTVTPAERTPSVSGSATQGYSMSADQDPEKNATTSTVTPVERKPSVSGSHWCCLRSQNVNPREATPEVSEYWKISDPRVILKYLYRLNQLHAQMVLFKDYKNLAPKSGLNFVADNEYFKDLEEHLHRYCK